VHSHVSDASARTLDQPPNRRRTQWPKTLVEDDQWHPEAVRETGTDSMPIT
jgi:hypothetical protein